MGHRTRTCLAAGCLGFALGLPTVTLAQYPSPQTLPPRASGQIGAGYGSSGQAGRSGSTTDPARRGSAAGAGQPGGATSGASGTEAGGTASPGDAGSNTLPGTGTDAGANGAGAADALGATGAGTALSSGLGGGASGAPSYFGMLGDAPNMPRLTILQRVPQPPPLPNPGGTPVPPNIPGRGGRLRAAAVLPSVRGFKIAENQSPQPQDRVYYSFNYFDNLNQDVNRQLGSPIDHLKAYRHVFGFEKTFLEGRASFGLRLPLDSLSTTSTLPQLGGTTQAVGDLAAIFKYAVIQDRDAGRLLSLGLLVNAPTGPRTFANAKGIRSPHNAGLQPFVGFIRSYGKLYLQGFSSIEVPTNPNDATVFYNDLGLGYYVYQSSDLDKFITAIAPTFEAHVNTPLNHRNPYNLNDLAGTYDFVDLTFGTNIQIGRRGLLALAVVEPVTGPRPFHLETIVQFNLRF